MKNNKKTAYILNDKARDMSYAKSSVEVMAVATIDHIREFHMEFEEYRPTPLWSLEALSKELQVKKILVKDESHRFGLNAFKVLGGAYAVGKYLADRLGIDIEEVTFEKLQSAEVKKQLGDITFVTATDGNHGRGIAWAAKHLGQKSVIFMPKGTAEERLRNIKNEGAEASITDMNYDDAVRHALKYAEAHNGVLIQDSAWDGYEQIPTWIMQGYATVVDEIVLQIKEEGHEKPTHVFLQAGVGSFAGGVLGFLVSYYGEDYPTAIVVEPDKAACIYKSAKVGDGKPYAVTGEMQTIMAGLACGEPSIVSWSILRDYADAYVACPDNLAALGMRILGNPLSGDPRIVSGESGAIGMGLLYALEKDQQLAALKEAVGIDDNSVVLIISTEGDTDAAGYRKVVWEGAYGNE